MSPGGLMCVSGLPCAEQSGTEPGGKTRAAGGGLRGLVSCGGGCAWRFGKLKAEGSRRQSGQPHGDGGRPFRFSRQRLREHGHIRR